MRKKLFKYNDKLYRQTHERGQICNEIYYPDLDIMTIVDYMYSDDFDIPDNAVVLSSKKFRREVDKLRIQIKMIKELIK